MISHLICILRGRVDSKYSGETDVVETEAGAEGSTHDGASYHSSLELESSLLILGGLICFLRGHLFLQKESHRFPSPERVG